jgi:COG4 transport protein
MVKIEQFWKINYFNSIQTPLGPGYLLDVIERLQKECDKESRRILTELIQKRNLDQIIRQVF